VADEAGVSGAADEVPCPPASVIVTDAELPVTVASADATIRSAFPAAVAVKRMVFLAALKVTLFPSAVPEPGSSSLSREAENFRVFDASAVQVTVTERLSPTLSSFLETPMVVTAPAGVAPAVIGSAVYTAKSNRAIESTSAFLTNFFILSIFTTSQ
jgi:hypothetical protein